MADTIDLSQIAEFQDDPESFNSKCSIIAKIFIETATAPKNRSKHIIFFTGSGVSASANIPTFRGVDGLWTRKAQNRPPPSNYVNQPLVNAKPTFFHHFLKFLTVDLGIVKHVTSANIDGLHRRSNIPAEKLSEIHGNAFVKRCWRCGYQEENLDEEVESGYNGDSCVVCRRESIDPSLPCSCHCTATKCPRCEKAGRAEAGNSKLSILLKDTIIHFNENLLDKPHKESLKHSELADVCIVVGSSLSVSPSCEIAERVAERRKKLIIVNLQKTPSDDLAAVRIFGKSDHMAETVLKLMLKQLKTIVQGSNEESSIVEMVKVVEVRKKLKEFVSFMEEEKLKAQKQEEREKAESSSKNKKQKSGEQEEQRTENGITSSLSSSSSTRTRRCSLLLDNGFGADNSLLERKRPILFSNLPHHHNAKRRERQEDEIEEDNKTHEKNDDDHIATKTQKKKLIEKITSKTTTKATSASASSLINYKTTPITQANDKLLKLCRNFGCVFGNYHKFCNDNRKNHEWTLFVRPNYPECVRCVIFTIHHDFAPNNVIQQSLDELDWTEYEGNEKSKNNDSSSSLSSLSNSNAHNKQNNNNFNKQKKKPEVWWYREFKVTRVGWGEFEAKIEIHLVNGFVMKRKHQLRFDLAENSSSTSAYAGCKM